MKIITLNTWGGRAGTENLLDFFTRHHDVDVFCLQEIYSGGEHNKIEQMGNDGGKEYNLFSLIQQALPGYGGYFRPSLGEFYGIAMFVKNDLTVLEEGERFVCKHKGFIPEGNLGYHARNIQYVKIQQAGKEVYVINFHGLWTGQGKGDTEDRIDQSKKILEFTNGLTEEYVLCGDFNLNPDTESIRLFEDAGLKNLITENNITSTRTSFYKNETEKIADYVFLSSGLEVQNFKVLPEEVSDHSAIALEIE